MNKYIIIISAWLCSLSASSQTEGYNPENPPLPDTPTLSYTLSVNVTPKGAAGINVSNQYKYAAGEEIGLWTWPMSGFEFVYWADEKGDTVSTSSRYYFAMPEHDLALTAVYRYNPTSPVIPGSNHFDPYTGEVIVDYFTPGNMSWAIDKAANDDPEAVTKIVVAGELSSKDLFYFGNYPSCTTVDLSRTSAVDAIPYACFWGNSNINRLLLPPSVTAIESDAFKDATALSELTSYSTVPPSLGARVFDGVSEGLIVYVPASSVRLYESAEGWQEYVESGVITIAPIQDQVVSVEVCLPEVCSDGRYKNSQLELVNVKSGQKYRYVITDRINYIFNNIVKNTQYNAYLKTASGDVLATITDISVQDENISVSFEADGMKEFRDVYVKVFAGENDVTSLCRVQWYNAKGVFVGDDVRVGGQISGNVLKCMVSLPDELAMQYVLPQPQTHEVVDDENMITFSLQPMEKILISGKVSDRMNMTMLADATVTVTQTLNGIYTKSYSVRTDSRGVYSFEAFVAPTSLVFASADYVSQNMELSADELGSSELTLDEIRLKPINGAVITTDYTFTTSAVGGTEGTVENSYSNYSNVAYSIFNVTTQSEITQFNIQYPTIVLLQDVETGDELRITASSKNNSFMPVSVAGVVDENCRMRVTVPIVELGGIKASFTTTENSKVIAILYDSEGNLVSKYPYRSANISISNLTDGEYSLVTMGESDFFGSIYNLGKYEEAGLRQDVDYIVNRVEVKSGVISTVRNALIPFFDESKFYYTGSGTSFSVNKNSIVAGNYLTMTAKIDFKDVVSESVSDVELNVELPKGTSLVDNSVMVGSDIALYDYADNKLRVRLDNKADRVRFCVIPTQSGKYAPNASVMFSLNGKSINQPIGNVEYTVESLGIKVPRETQSSDIVVSGVAVGGSQVTVYSDDVMLGTTKALANGYWSLSVGLPSPCNLNTYNIYAKVLTKTGIEMQSETKSCTYNEDYVVAETVEMSFFNGWLRRNVSVTFDLLNAKTSSNSYSFYSATDFTFLAKLSSHNDNIKGVTIKVYTDHNEWYRLPATYNAKLGKWVASQYFTSSSLPIGVKVEIDSDTPVCLDSEMVNVAVNNLQASLNRMSSGNEELDSLMTKLSESMNAESFDFESQKSLMEQLAASVGSSYTFNDQGEVTDSDVDALIAEIAEIMNSGDDIVSLDGLFGIDVADLSQLQEYLEGIELKDCEDLSHESLVDAGYKLMPKTDGSFVYILIDAEGISLVDLSQNVRIVVRHGSDLYDMVVSNDIEGVKTLCDQISSALQELQNAVNGVSDAIDALEATIIKSNKKYSDVIATLFDKLLVYQRGGNTSKLGAIEAKIRNVIAAKESNRKVLDFINSNLKQYRVGPNSCKAFGIFGFMFTLKDALADLRKLVDLYAMTIPCPDDEANAQTVRGDIVASGIEAGSFYLGVILANTASSTSLQGSIAAAVPTSGLSLAASAVSLGTIISNDIAAKAYSDKFKAVVTDLKRRVSALKCNAEEEEEEEEEKPYPLVSPILDPSGYVYESVPSNRLQGVMATCYYKEIVSDMYGDKHEEVVLWNAEEYAQKNPLFTDENGMYAWDVPQGLWQVRFEKEGYEPTQSEWLPVPPPQMDVNIAMVQNSQPEVSTVRAYEDGVEIEFSKYMNPESLNSDNIYVQVVRGGEVSVIADATIEMLNAEAISEGSTDMCASKVKVVTDQLGYYDEARIIISKNVRSYAGITMRENFEQQLDVERKVQELLVDATVNVAYEGTAELHIAAIPAEAAAGKTITVSSLSELIARPLITPDNGEESQEYDITLDENGEATLVVSGELYGSTAISYTMHEASINASTIINVVDEKKLELVKTPVASRVSGTAVYRGQTVALTCESEGATIYYTTDGSCPCDEQTRIKYERPIVINNDMTIKYYAIGANFDESEIKESSYTIRQSNVKLNLAKGWNWSSHDKASPLSVNDFVDSSISSILTQEAELTEDPVLGMVGTLTEIDGSQSMKIKTKDNLLKSFSGEQYNPALTPINLYKGWNWLGYPLSIVMDIDEALSLMEAEEGDCISNLEEGFAVYNDGQWQGTLQILSPGNGYLYNSVSDKSFIYNNLPTTSNARALNRGRLEITASPWTVDKHAYQNLMPVIAQVCNEDGSVSNETYHVAAFAGEECRASGTYNGGILYLSVYGNGKEEISFVVQDIATGIIYETNQTIHFDGDVVGTVASPYKLVIGNESTGVGSVNTTRPTVGAYNMQGMRVSSPKGKGVYIVTTTDSEGNTLVKKQVCQ